MKKIILILILVVQAFSIQIQSNIYEYADMVSKFNKVDILVNADIKLNDYYFYTDKQNPKPNLEVFKKMLELQGLKLLRVDDFYFVYDPKHKNKIKNKNSDFISFDNDSSFFDSDDNSTIDEENLYYLKLKNNSYREVDSVLSIYDKNSTYIAKDNSVAFKATAKQYSEILDSVKSFDEKRLSQVIFKITILETNLDDIKERGTQINSLFKAFNHVDLKYFINLITVPYSQETNIINDKKDGFYGIVSFLDKNNISKILASPFLVAKNNTEVYFSSVKNIPYLQNTSTFQQNGTSIQNTFDYKDVGLKLWLKPIVIDDFVDFDLYLIFDNILSGPDNKTPITSKKELKSSYSLKKGQMLVLSGINQESQFYKRSGIPLLKDIWLLKYLFSTNVKEKLNSVLTISIEVL